MFRGLQPHPQGLVEGTAAAEGLVEGASTATDADEAEVERVRAKFRDEDGLGDLWPDQPYRRFLEQQQGGEQ